MVSSAGHGGLSAVGTVRDRRLSERFALDRDAVLVGEGEACAGGVTGRLLDLSGAGALVEVRGELPERGSVFRARLMLADKPTAACPVRLVRVLPRGDGGGVPSVGVRFEDSTGVVLAEVAEFLATAIQPATSLAELAEAAQSGRPEVRAIDPAVLARIALRGRGRLFRVADGDGIGHPEYLSVQAAGGDGPVTLLALPPGGGRWAPPACDLLVTLVSEGYRSLILLRAMLCAGSWPARLLPVCAALVRRRTGDRLRLGESDLVEARIVHPLLPGRTVVRPVRDIGEGGLCLEGDVRSDVLSPGMFLPEVEVALPDGTRVDMSVSLRSVRPRADRPGHLYGLRIDAVRPLEAWDRFFMERLAPAMRPLEAGEVPMAWELFDRTGYLREKASELILPQRRPFLRAWSRLANAKPLGMGFVVRDRESPRGVVFRTQVYPGTWLLHQLALDLRSPTVAVSKASLAGQIYRGVVHLCYRLPELRHTLIVYNAENPWSRYAYDDFLALAADEDAFSLEHLRIVEKPVDRGDAGEDGGTAGAQARAADTPGAVDGLAATPDSRGPGPADAPTLVRPFAEADRSAVEEAARKTIPPAAREALGLEPLDPDLGDLGRLFLEQGLHRRRVVLVAERDGCMLGAAIVDSASPGINIFGLLDAVTLLPAAPGTSDWSWTGPLLAAVEERRRTEGAASVVALLPADWPVACLPPGFAPVAPVRRWIARRSLLPDYLTYLDEHFGAAIRAEEKAAQ
jgi:hypothetical protein